MKNITKTIISGFLIILLANAAFGFAGMGAKTNNTNNTTFPQGSGIIKQDINNTTQSDQDIIMVQHLIEVDALQLKAQNSLFIRETLIFRNSGTKDFYGDLRTWLPDGSDNINLAKSEMMTGGGQVPITNFSKNGNIISWKEYVEQNSQLPFLYTVEYNVKQAESGKTNIEIFSKKIAIPTYISYKYMEKPDLAAIILKITRQQGSTVKFIDENGNKIAATEVDEKEEIFRFSDPRFKEINVEISQTGSAPAGIQSDAARFAPYIVIGILIILALSYPFIKKKLRSDKNGEETPEEPGETETEEPEESEEEAEEIIGDEKIEDLEKLKKDILSKINGLEKEYESGNLIDEDYEDKRNSYQAKLKGIEKKLKQMG